MIPERRKGYITPAVVLTYIHMGWRKVAGHHYYDPYVKLVTDRGRMSAMRRDAENISAWYNENRKHWTDAQCLQAARDILAIQRGPVHWMHTRLRTGLSELHYQAAKSWAAREHDAPGSVNMSAPGLPSTLRAELINLLAPCLPKGRDVYVTVRDALHFAFYGPTAPGEAWKSAHSNKIDL